MNSETNHESIKVIDNFLSDEEFNEVFSMIADSEFPWFYGLVVSGSKYTQFTHCFYQHDEPTYYYPRMKFFRDKLKMKSLVRIKANLNPRTETLNEHDYHIDFTNMKTAVFYLNTCNGYTKFKTGEKVDSVKNRIVIFDSNLEHTGTSCTDTHARLVINFNYF
jgi:hypothetical protein